MSTDVQPRLMTIPQAAAYLASRVWTIRSLIWSGELPRIRAGKRFLLDRADLDRWVERSKEREGLG